LLGPLPSLTQQPTAFKSGSQLPSISTDTKKTSPFPPFDAKKSAFTVKQEEEEEEEEEEDYENQYEEEEEEDDADFDANELLNLTDYQNKRKQAEKLRAAQALKETKKKQVAPAPAQASSVSSSQACSIFRLELTQIWMPSSSPRVTATHSTMTKCWQPTPRTKSKSLVRQLP
jgi:hypothetical protein